MVGLRIQLAKDEPRLVLHKIVELLPGNWQFLCRVLLLLQQQLIQQQLLQQQLLLRRKLLQMLHSNLLMNPSITTWSKLWM